ncbi:MAG TPA: AAA family ATPase [Candidatus Bathyarchaeia archaeon]|nr:AAA family ATPase [Candidatus Bathyarchaeia archaeon]
MYNTFYGFAESPFNMTPNSRFFYNSGKHTEALSTLLYAIRERKGFVVVTGEIGSGKTTVCRAVLNQLGADTEFALITNTHLGARDLLSTILEDLNVDFHAGSKARLLSQLNQYLIDQMRQDKNVVVIIDEAQNLKPSVLEEVRMLSNLETEREKLIQIVFLGQPELKKKLALPQLEQLRQRIAVYFHLTPLSKEDAFAYIRYRLEVAGAGDREIFSDHALELAAEFSGGVPRVINQICDSALLSGYVRDIKIIDADLMEEVISESPLRQISG